MTVSGKKFGGIGLRKNLTFTFEPIL